MVVCFEIFKYLFAINKPVQGEVMAMEFEVESVPASPAPSMAALRSRVEQQSTLIAMLKQRGDNTLSEVLRERVQ